MADPFIAELRIMSFDFAPKGWAQCNGQLMQINQNQPLFSLLGTTFGGNGQTTFALPDLRGRVPISQGAGYVMGQQVGESTHTLKQSEMPLHIHTIVASQTDGDVPVPHGAQAGNILARTVNNVYQTVQSITPLNAGTLAMVGGSQPHENMQPYLGLNVCIALVGIFPSRN